MDITNSYTYFSICSNGILTANGLKASDRGIFDPNEISARLAITPFNVKSYGQLRRDGVSNFLFSSWSAEKSNKERLDVEQQCLETISQLKYKIEEINKIKEEYDVSCSINVVPIIFGDETPILIFNQEIIEFCYLTGSVIDVDMYVNTSD